MTIRFHFRRVGAIIICAALVSVGGKYIFDAYGRTTATECLGATSHNNLYRAESCVTGGDGNLLFYVGRLYDARSGKLLARVDFDSLDGGDPIFTPDGSGVFFRGAQDSSEGSISIPPNWHDRLRAMLP